MVATFFLFFFFGGGGGGNYFIKMLKVNYSLIDAVVHYFASHYMYRNKPHQYLEKGAAYSFTDCGGRIASPISGPTTGDSN